ncbi:LysE family translocator [Terrimicrobium sacchariphilum]|nr:LysE family translocator [Terrimicrobium sacchariphilum]
MSPALLAAWCGTMAVISLTPGAGAVASMSSGATYGWMRGIWTAVGQQLALVFLLMVAAVGLSSLLHTVPFAFFVMQLAGAMYLAWIGIRLILQSFHEKQMGGPGRQAIPSTPTGMIRHGFLVNATNPKALLAMFVITPRFLNPQEALIPQYAIMGLCMVTIDIVVMAGYTGVGASVLRSLTESRWRRRVDRLFGSLFLIAAVIVARG